MTLEVSVIHSEMSTHLDVALLFKLPLSTRFFFRKSICTSNSFANFKNRYMDIT